MKMGDLALCVQNASPRYEAYKIKAGEYVTILSIGPKRQRAHVLAKHGRASIAVSRLRVVPRSIKDGLQALQRAEQEIRRENR